MNFLDDYILSSFFWEDGRVMIVVSIICSFFFRLLFKHIADHFSKKRIMLVPYFLYFIGMLFVVV